MKKIGYVVTVSSTIHAFFVEQLQYLANNGFEVHVICSQDDDLQSLLGNRIKYIPCDMPRGINVLQTAKAIVRLVKIIRKEKYDLIQYSTPNAAFNTSIAASLCGVKVRNYHLMGFRYMGESGIKYFMLKLMEKITCTLSTHIECVSFSNMKIGIENGFFPKSKALVVWNGSTGGVDLTRFDIRNKSVWKTKVRQKYGITEDQIVYGFVGRITKDKGIDELISAFKMLQTSGLNSILIMIGSFENKECLNQNLLKWAERNENIIFVPNVTNIEQYYAALDILVLPSYREGFGNVLIEAQAMGVPVITTKIPGPIDAMQENKTGYLVPVKNTEELYKCMLEINNEQILKAFSSNARKFVEMRFDSKTLVKEILIRKKSLLI